MFKAKTLITKDNYIDVINSLKYGLLTCHYDSAESKQLSNNMIDVINQYTGSSTIEERKAVIDTCINGEWVCDEVEGVYQLLYKRYDMPVPILSKSNYNIESIVINCKLNESIVVIDGFELSLVPYYKMIAKRHDIKFTGNGFNGKMKSLSIRKQIEDAFLSGKHSVSFNSENINPYSIRNGASTYGNIVGKKFRVELKKGLVVIHFKELSEYDKITSSIRASYESLCLIKGKKEVDDFINELISFDVKVPEKTIGESFVKTALEKVIPEQLVDSPYKLYGKSVTKSEYSAAEIWQRQGYASEYNMEHGIEGKEDKTPVVSDSINQYENDSINEYENDSNDNYNSDSDYNSENENENESFEDEDDDF